MTTIYATFCYGVKGMCEWGTSRILISISAVILPMKTRQNDIWSMDDTDSGHQDTGQEHGNDHNPSIGGARARVNGAGER